MMLPCIHVAMYLGMVLVLLGKRRSRGKTRQQKRCRKTLHKKRTRLSQKRQTWADVASKQEEEASPESFCARTAAVVSMAGTMPQGSYRVYYVEICGHNTVRILQPDDMSCEGQARLVDLRPESRHAKPSQPTPSQGHRTPRKATQATATQGTPRHDKPRHGSETLQK